MECRKAPRWREPPLQAGGDGPGPQGEGEPQGSLLWDGAWKPPLQQQPPAGDEVAGWEQSEGGGAARGGVGAAQRGAGRGTYQRDCPSIKRVPASPDETRSQARSHPTPRAALKAALNQRILFKFIQDVAVFFCSDRRGIWKCSFFLFFLSFFFFIAVLKRSLAV